MKNLTNKAIAILGITLSITCVSITSCKKDSTDTTDTTSTGGTNTVPDVYKKVYGATSITSDGTYITFKSTNLPDHKSAYWPSTNALYEAYTGTNNFNGDGNFGFAPGVITTQTFTLKIPLNPKLNTAHSATGMSAIGIALNGVAIFNQYAGGGTALSAEAGGFDQFWGHPQQSGIYHYHVEPLYLTTVKSTKSGLLGFLLDGFPVYGPTEEDGTKVTNSLLDVYHGHTHVTVDYPTGIYHYHFTSTAPYLNGNGYYGTPGTVSI